ncbi:MAG: acyltransferase [Desulfobulbaceae bacterium]|nr:acyltransferase [Desulfobulbaceae bacterium]
MDVSGVFAWCNLHGLLKIILLALSRKLFLKYVGVRHGNRCRFVNMKPNTFGSEPYLITLGDHVTVASGVKFITHDGGVWVLREKHPRIDVFKPIVIGSNVFIGLNSIILPGANVGGDCVIGAGSVVSGTLPGNAVYAGVPARKIRDLADYERDMVGIGLETKGLPYRQKRKIILHHMLRKGTTGGRGSR